MWVFKEWGLGGYGKSPASTSRHPGDRRTTELRCSKLLKLESELVHLRGISG